MWCTPLIETDQKRRKLSLGCFLPLFVSLAMYPIALIPEKRALSDDGPPNSWESCSPCRGVGTVDRSRGTSREERFQFWGHPWQWQRTRWHTHRGRRAGVRGLGGAGERAVRLNDPSKCFVLWAAPQCSGLAGQAASENSFSGARSFYGDPDRGLTHVRGHKSLLGHDAGCLTGLGVSSLRESFMGSGEARSLVCRWWLFMRNFVLSDAPEMFVLLNLVDSVHLKDREIKEDESAEHSQLANTSTLPSSDVAESTSEGVLGSFFLISAQKERFLFQKTRRDTGEDVGDTDTKRRQMWEM